MWEWITVALVICSIFFWILGRMAALVIGTNARWRQQRLDRLRRKGWRPHTLHSGVVVMLPPKEFLLYGSGHQRT
jgi:hypothetical protein